MIRRYKGITTTSICISAFLIFFTFSCNKQDQQAEVGVDESPVVIESMSNKDTRINDINSPIIESWKPELLSINLTGGSTANSPLRFMFNHPMIQQDSLVLKRFPAITFEPACQTMHWSLQLRLMEIFT